MTLCLGVIKGPITYNLSYAFLAARGRCLGVVKDLVPINIITTLPVMKYRATSQGVFYSYKPVSKGS